MSAAKPLPANPDTMDVLRNLFAIPSLDENVTKEVSDAQLNKLSGHPIDEYALNSVREKADSEVTSSAHTVQAEKESDQHEVAQAEAKEISAPGQSAKVAIDHIVTQSSDQATTVQNGFISQSDLVTVLESFVNVVFEGRFAPPHSNLPMSIEPTSQVSAPLIAQLEEKNTEINDLKTLLVEAQSTIIKLLTDRVDDRSKIASLESELKLLPDLQRGRHAAFPSPTDAETLRDDLSKLQAEVDRLSQSPILVSLIKAKMPLSGWLSDVGSSLA